MSAVLPAELPTEVATSRVALAGRDIRSVIAPWLAAALPGLLLLGIVFLQLSRGWAPISDDAVIATRAWDVLSKAVPLVGQATLAHGPKGRAVYDLGPLYYFLLTLPEHASPTTGPLLGAAGIWLAAAGTFVVAARSAYGATGMFVASATLFLLAWEVPTVVTDPLWNPHAAVMWFLSATASLLAVIGGRHRWYPFATFAASLAIQANIVLLAPMVVLWLAATAAATAATATMTGTADTRLAVRVRRVGPGVLVGIVCWIPTVVQQVAGRSGNLSSFTWYLSHHASVGLVFGLKSIASVVDPRIMAAAVRTGSVVFTSTFVAQESPVVGILVMCVLGLLATWCLTHNRAEGRALGVALLVAISFVFTFADVSPDALGSVDYLSVVLIAMASVFWILLILAALSAVPDRFSELAPRSFGPLSYVLVVAAAAMLLSRTVGVADMATSASSQSIVKDATAYVEQHVPRGPVVAAIAVDGPRPEGIADYADSAGVAWNLRVAGWRPEIYGALWSVFGTTYAASRGAYVVVAHVSDANQRIQSITVRRPSS